MEFPKPRMKISELIPLGFSRDELYRYAHMKGCPVSRTGSTRNSHIIFDTEEFKKWLKEKDASL